jgi:E3 ubiquitin-protein ligase UBR4
MERLVANKTIHLNSSVRDVEKKVSIPFFTPLSPSEEQAMFVIHRFRDSLRDATEEILAQVETKRIEKKSFIECWTESSPHSIDIASRERLIDHQ